ncbi:MAG: AAA family ATPase [Deltaproteobacteria bacterium]|nr:AAA family ATPase [Deltaproteobacteria bacterium]
MFAQIRDKNLFYAGQTEYIYNLLNKKSFLSRPRRY